MQIDLPEVVAEVRTAFERYEQALVSNDVVTLNSLFHDDVRTIRYGGAENLYGYAAIESFRAARSPAGLAPHLIQDRHYDLWPRRRRCLDVVRASPRRRAKSAGRCRPGAKFAEGWRVVAAHVSVIHRSSSAPAGKDGVVAEKERVAVWRARVKPKSVYGSAFRLGLSGRIKNQFCDRVGMRN